VFGFLPFPPETFFPERRGHSPFADAPAPPVKMCVIDGRSPTAKPFIRKNAAGPGKFGLEGVSSVTK
jgi:hypothetical protein